MRRQSGEEDEVRPESRIRQPESNPIPSVGLKPTIPAAQTPRPFTRESAHHRARPVTRVRPETRERSVNLRLDPRLLHTRRSLIVPCHVARLQRGSSWLRRLNRLDGGLFGSGNLFPARLTPFRPSRTWFRPCLR